MTTRIGIDASAGLRVRRVLAMLTVVVAAGAAGGCAYFNTFYNAKKAFNEGEEIAREVDPRNQPTSAQRSKYSIAINKCELVLEEFPNSGLVDDALFLMGKSYYRLKTYRAALRNFDNVLANFPGSDLEEEALFLKAMAHLELGEDQSSVDVFRRLNETYPDSEFTKEALYQTGDSYVRRQRFQQAVDAYRFFLDTTEQHEQRQRVVLEAALAYMELEQFAQADTVLQMMNPKKATAQQQFDAEFLRVRALKELDRADESLPILAALGDQAGRFDRRGEVLVLEGEVQLALGNESEGLEVLGRAADEFKATPVEPQARLAVANYILKTRGPDDPQVVEELKLALENRGGGEFMSQVQSRRQQLERYTRLSKQLEEEDVVVEDVSFQLAELLLIDLELPRSALPHYRRVMKEAPDGAQAPKAAYAVGYIHEEILAQPDSAAAAYALLRDQYVESPQAQSLDGIVFLEARAPRLPPSREAGDVALAEGENGRDADGSVGSTRLSGDTRRRVRSLARGGPGAVTPRRGRF